MPPIRATALASRLRCCQQHQARASDRSCMLPSAASDHCASSSASARSKRGGCVYPVGYTTFSQHHHAIHCLEPPAHTPTHGSTAIQPSIHGHPTRSACEHLDGFPFWYTWYSVGVSCVRELIGPTINAVRPLARCSSAGWLTPQPKRGRFRRSCLSSSPREWLPSWSHAW